LDFIIILYKMSPSKDTTIFLKMYEILKPFFFFFFFFFFFYNVVLMHIGFCMSVFSVLYLLLILRSVIFTVLKNEFQYLLYFKMLLTNFNERKGFFFLLIKIYILK